MDYFSLGSKLDYPELNGIVYLLRKFKRLTSDLRLGSNSISSDYGTYNVTGGLTSVGGNFILEDDVTITSSDVLLNCFYTFYFTVVDVNLSGTVNRRVISVTGDTGDNGVLEVVLSPDLLEDDEVILPDFKVDIVFDPHEYYTPVSSLDITVEVDKSYITVGETATVTATVLDGSGSPVEDLDLQFNFNGDIVTDTTDSEGIASAEYTGTGAGWVTVIVNGRSITFYDNNVTIATVTGNSIQLGFLFLPWLTTTGDVVIDWGDGTSDTVNNPNSQLTHDYTDGESSHNIAFLGEVTSLGTSCFYQCTGLTSITISDSVTSLGRQCFSNCTGLTSITIPNSVTSLGNDCFYGCTGLTSIIIPNSVISLGSGCFYGCTGLTSITIPNSVTSLGGNCFYNCTGLTSVTIPSSVTSLGGTCFYGCSALVDYQLYWAGNNIITYNSNKMSNNTNTIFTIPQGETSNYTSKGYPTAKLVERGESLTLTCDKPIIEETETSTITATLKDTGTPLTGKTLNYQVKHGNTVISSGTKTTNSSGQATISYTGTGVGKINIIISYNSLEANSEIIDGLWYDQATNTGHKTSWYNYQNILTVDYPAMYDATRVRKLEEDTNLRYYYYNDPAISETKISGYYSITTPSIIEFDVLSIVGTIYIGMYDGTNQVAPEINRKGHYKIVNDGNNSKLYKDDVELGSYTLTGSNFRFGFGFNAENEGLVFKDFVVYAMGSEPVHTYSLSIASDKQSILTSESVTISGTLLMDSSPYTGQSVALYDGSTLIDTLTTDSNGEYSKTISGLSAGTHSFKAVNTNAESTTINVTVTEPTPVHDYSLTVTGTAIIQTGDNDNITATLKDNGVVVSGETLNYQIKHGSTVIDSGTDTTDSNGQISITYTGTGAGDIDVIVSYGSLLQETYEVQDYILYDSTGFSKTTTTSTDTSYPTEYDFALQSINNFQLEFDYNNPTGFRLYFASVKVTNVGDNIQYGIGFTRDGSGRLTFTERTTTTSNTTCQSISSGTNHYKVVFNGNTVSVWVNDVQQVNNRTLSWWSSHFPYYFNWAIWGIGTGTVSNIKVKAL